jgi:hypothetical protein
MIEIRIDTENEDFNISFLKPTKEEYKLLSRYGKIWEDWYWNKNTDSNQSTIFQIGDFVTGKDATDGKYYKIQDLKKDFGTERIKIMDQWMASSLFIKSNGIE